MRPASYSQKLWRFCKNQRVEAPALIDPMHQAIRHEVTETPDGVLLAVHDWSTLSFGSHPSKTDRAILTHASDVGYDLATVLIVRASDGAPIAPAAVSLTTADVVHTTRDDGNLPTVDTPHVDQVKGAMGYVGGLSLGVPVVHVIDREADSVGHWRDWAAAGHLALVRGDDRKVLHEGQKRLLSEVAERLREDHAFQDAGEVLYRGRKAQMFVAEAEVVLYRPARRNVGDGKQVEIPGPPLALRLVVAEVRNASGHVLARWLLLTNVPARLADAATIAVWYYFRWRIESLHKLMKSAGWELERWLQQTGERLLRKLLVAFGACVSVWALERRDDAESEEFKQILMDMSGRQTKRSKPITTTGLLTGLWALQAAMARLVHHSPEQLNAMLKNHLPLFATTQQLAGFV
jgi:hypothetical protein